MAAPAPRPQTVPRLGARVLAVGAAWLGVALAVGASGRLGAIPPPFPQFVLLGLTGTLLILVWTVPAIRAWAAGLDIRALAWVHVSRFVGAYFLVLHARGELPYAFAVPGGWGDIVVAAAALALVLLAPTAGDAARLAYTIWNLAGLADILFVVATAGRLGLADPASMGALTRLPLSLLPTFLVPLIIATHVVMLARLRAGGRTWGRSA